MLVCFLKSGTDWTGFLNIFFDKCRMGSIGVGAQVRCEAWTNLKRLGCLLAPGEVVPSSRSTHAVLRYQKAFHAFLGYDERAAPPERDAPPSRNQQKEPQPVQACPRNGMCISDLLLWLQRSKTWSGDLQVQIRSCFTKQKRGKKVHKRSFLWLQNSFHEQRVTCISKPQRIGHLFTRRSYWGPCWACSCCGGTLACEKKGWDLQLHHVNEKLTARKMSWFPILLRPFVKMWVMIFLPRLWTHSLPTGQTLEICCQRCCQQKWEGHHQHSIHFLTMTIFWALQFQQHFHSPMKKSCFQSQCIHMHSHSIPVPGDLLLQLSFSIFPPPVALAQRGRDGWAECGWIKAAK